MHYSLFLYSSQITKRFREWTGLVGFEVLCRDMLTVGETDILLLVRATDICTTDTQTENINISGSV